MKKNITTSCLVLLSLFILSGCSKIYIALGDKNMEQLQYVKAAKNYEKAVSKKSNNVAQKKLANTYRLMNDTKKGADAYAKVVNQSNAEPIDRFYYAQMLIANKKHNEAATILREYLKSNPGDKLAENMLKSCEAPEVFMKDTAKYTVTNAKIGNVTEFYGPVQYKDGLVISASIDGKGKDKVPQTGKSYYKLYFTKKDKSGAYTTPEKISGNINKNKLHTASATYSKDGSVVYYTASNTDGLSNTELLENVIGLKINKDTIANGTYLKGSEFPYNSKSYSVGHPALTPDSKTMYFISDMPGGFGGTDVYQTKWEGGKWAQPTNLGEKINTVGNEMYPFVDSLGNLFFSSNGHKTLGGLDIFKATKNGNAWSQIENLNYPINSSTDDFGFMIYPDNKTGYLSSNRTGSDKIYEFVLQAAKVNIGGKVLSKIDGKPIAGAKVEITDKARNITDTVFTAEDGTYSYQLAPNTDFEITVSKEGYFSQSEDVTSINQVGDILKDFTLEVLEKDKPVVIDEADEKGVRPIFYDFDKSEIRSDAFEPLNKLAKRLKDNPKITIELSSHTDCRGTDTYNQDLSFKRAKSAKKYLESKGIKSNRIKVKGYGESKPVNKCIDGVPCTDDEYQANRRTEFKVIEIQK
jgi:outer membrane protein OmpA-like peptidoglycan-associated protein/tetratricopeptide (TPR) repeat protein